MITPGLHIRPPSWGPEELTRWPNFTALELSCKCAGRFCQGEYFHDPEFLDALQRLRVRIGKPLVINSPHRCTRWNKQEGGALHSRHLSIACDVALFGHDRHMLRKLAQLEGFRGIGLGETFLHIDRRAKLTVWDYGEASRKAWDVKAPTALRGLP